MKVFFIGSMNAEDHFAPALHRDAAQLWMQDLGEKLAAARHEIIVCSPFEGSLDREILIGAARVGGARTQIHYPDLPDIRAKFDALYATLGLSEPHRFPHLPLGTDGTRPTEYSWLFAQLAALDASHVVVAAGGKPGGASNLLLHLAEARRKQVVPLPGLGGSARQSFDRLRYTLEDQLGKLRPLLEQIDGAQLCNVLNKLSDGTAHLTREKDRPMHFFISYSRARPEEADLVESVLRRRNLSIFRDETTLETGKHLPTQIREHIARADVFISLWCRDYACSPWCYDELQFALERQDSGLQIWICDLDDTRIVHPEARELLYRNCPSRELLAAHLIERLDTLSGTDGQTARPVG